MNENEYSIGYEVLYSDCAHEYNMHLKYKKEASAFLQKPLVLQMIWLSPADLKCTVNLLYEEETDQLMRQRKMRE